VISFQSIYGNIIRRRRLSNASHGMLSFGRRMREALAAAAGAFPRAKPTARVPPFCGLAPPSSLRASPWLSTFPFYSPRSGPRNPVFPQPGPGLGFCPVCSSWPSSFSTHCASLRSNSRIFIAEERRSA